jgi:serine O-acetyltransferase
MHLTLSIRYQIQIPKEAKIGPGLNLGHATGIVLSPTVEIGANCNISQFVNIGSNHRKAATIGDNVYIGPMVCIVENVVIGNNVTIGAGSVVIKNIPENSTAVGNPSRVVNQNDPGRYIMNKYDA